MATSDGRVSVRVAAALTGRADAADKVTARRRKAHESSANRESTITAVRASGTQNPIVSDQT
jgi:hypothetical protein